MVREKLKITRRSGNVFRDIGFDRDEAEDLEVRAEALRKVLAEGEGFEPSKACALPVFKTGALDHSATLPT